MQESSSPELLERPVILRFHLSHPLSSLPLSPCSQTGQLHGRKVSPGQQKVEKFADRSRSRRLGLFHYPALKGFFLKRDDKSSSPPDTIPFIWHYPNRRHGVGVKAADSPEHLHVHSHRLKESSRDRFIHLCITTFDQYIVCSCSTKTIYQVNLILWRITF